MPLGITHTHIKDRQKLLSASVRGCEKPPITTYTTNTIHVDTREHCRPWLGPHVHMHWTVNIVIHGQKLTRHNLNFFSAQEQ